MRMRMRDGRHRARTLIASEQKSYMSRVSGYVTARMILDLTPAWSWLSGVAFQKKLHAYTHTCAHTHGRVSMHGCVSMCTAWACVRRLESVASVVGSAEWPSQPSRLHV
jgi:hypothetical protein